MKKFLVVIPLLLLHLSAASQLTVKTKEMGRLFPSGQPVEGQVYTGRNHIRSWVAMDGGNKILITDVQTRGGGQKMKNKGTVGCYDLRDGSTLWQKQVNYKWEKPVLYDSVVIMEGYGSRLVKNYYDALSGELLYESSDVLMGSLPDGNLLRWHTNRGKGILSSVSTGGKVRWEFSYDGEKLPSGNFMLDDTTLMVIAAGLHSIDIRTGQGWNYTASTEIPGRHALRSARALRVNNYTLDYYAGSMVWSNYPVSPVIEGIYTNVYQEDGYMYWGSAEKFFCLDASDGSIVWENPLGVVEVSEGTIFTIDGRLYHFNHGAVQDDIHNYRCGEPFVAVYDCATGELLSKVLTRRILSFVVDSENMRSYILTPDGIIPYFMEDGLTGEIFSFDALSTGIIPFYLRDDALVKEKDGEGFRFIRQLYPSDSFVLALAGVKCWIISGNAMEVIDEVKWDRVSVPQKITTGHIITSDGTSTRFLNIAQERIAEIKAGFEVEYIDKYMFWNDGRHIHRLDLSDFFPGWEEDAALAGQGIDIEERMIIY